MEDMIVLVGIEAMQFQQGKIQSQYRHISEQQALMKNLQKAMAAAAHTKGAARLQDIKFDFTDPLTGQTVKMDLKTFMDRFGIESPKPQYHGIIKFIKDVADAIGKLVGKAVDFIKAQFPELAHALDDIGKWMMENLVEPIKQLVRHLDKQIGEFMKSDLGKELSLVAVVAAGLGAIVAGAMFAAMLAPVMGVGAGLVIGEIIGFGAAALMVLTGVKVKEGDWDLYEMAKELAGGIARFLEEHLEEILESWTESLDTEQWKEVEQNLKINSDSASAMAQQDHLRLSSALNEYNELTQMVSNNLNKVTQMNLNVIGNMR
ncbi:hypothetical protein D779_1160 [Imhoffiella purpurea]|uniref:Uncharacterized protein n=1 Tax=Imhoffiella purpurea TaxID=1249627 RepID=W9V7U4_9GAMM|nr:hypothetical protein D779_1160 [Imhoffiella purpurea]